jgi:hypothetical protein
VIGENSGKQRAMILIVALLAVVIYVSLRFLLADDETRIRRMVYKGIVAVEKKEIKSCAFLISDFYQDSYGYDKEQLLEAAGKIFEELRRIKVEIKKLVIEVEDLEAVGQIRLVCYFRKTNDTQLYYDSCKIRLVFVKEPKGWKIVTLEYFGSQELLLLQGAV